VRTQDGIVRLNHGSGDAGCGVDGELKLGFLAIIGRETLKKERAKTRSSSTSKRVEDQEALERRAVILE
jgi:hypothetical protein